MLPPGTRVMPLMPSQDSLALREGTQTSFVYGCCSSPKLMGVWDIGLHAPPFPTACCKCNYFTCPFSVSDFNYPQLLRCQDYWVISTMQEVGPIKSKVQSLSSTKKSFFQLFVWCWADFLNRSKTKPLFSWCSHEVLPLMIYSSPDLGSSLLQTC